MEQSRPPGVLAMVDFDNIRSNIHGLEAEQVPRWLMDELCKQGEIAFAFALVDYRTMSPSVDRALMINGFFPVQCPKSVIATTGERKDTVDGMAIELMHRIMTNAPAITTIVFASGDRDFVPALATWRNRKKEIVVMAQNGIAREMREVATCVVELAAPVAQIKARPAVVGFGEALLAARDPDDFRLCHDPEVALVRDSVAAYVRNVMYRYTETGRTGHLTYTFLRRGLATQAGQVRYSEDDTEHLVRVMCQTMLRAERNESRTLCYPLNEAHPFVQYVARMATAA